MRTRHARFLLVVLFAGAAAVSPGSISAQVLDPCRATATLTPPPPFGHQVAGSATYACTNEHFSISVVGCLLLDGVPVHCDGVTRTNRPSASVDLYSPCLPGVWTTLAVGLGADRALPATDISEPKLITECDPLRPAP